MSRERNISTNRASNLLAEERLALGEPGGASLPASLARLESAIATWRSDERAQRQGVRR